MGGYKWNSKKEELQVEFDYAVKRYNEMRTRRKFKQNPNLLVPYIDKINTILKLQQKYDFGKRTGPLSRTKLFSRTRQNARSDLQYLRKLK